MRMNLFPFYLWHIYPLNTFRCLTFHNLLIHFICETIRIMHEHAGVGDVEGMEIGNFKVVGRFGRFELLQRYAFYFAERVVKEKNFIAASPLNA